MYPLDITKVRPSCSDAAVGMVYAKLVYFVGQLFAPEWAT